MSNPELVVRTARLLLRSWRHDDLLPFAELNSDPRVMEFFASPLTSDQSDRLAAAIQAHHEQHGYGLWAVEVPGAAPFIGFVGIARVSPGMPCAPAIEIGWRLAYDHWGRGYATEAAQAVVDLAFGRLQLRELVSLTAVVNVRSQAVMQRLGMTRSTADDFTHPRLPEGHRLRPHVLYRLKKPLPTAG